MTDHPLYTTSAGDDYLHIEVWLTRGMTYADELRHGGRRLVTLERATYDYRSHGELQVMRLHTSVTGVVDFEHDTSKFALVEVLMPATTYDEGNHRTMVGLLQDVRLHPLGVDPLTYDDGETGTGVCTHCEEPHQFAAYLPPEREDLNEVRGRLVRIEIRPQALVDERSGS